MGKASYFTESVKTIFKLLVWIVFQSSWDFAEIIQSFKDAHTFADSKTSFILIKLDPVIGRWVHSVGSAASITSTN